MKNLEVKESCERTEGENTLSFNHSLLIVYKSKLKFLKKTQKNKNESHTDGKTESSMGTSGPLRYKCVTKYNAGL